MRTNFFMNLLSFDRPCRPFDSLNVTKKTLRMDRAKKKLITNLKKEKDAKNMLRLLIRVTIDYPHQVIDTLNQITEKLTLPVWYMYLTCLIQLPNEVTSSLLPNVMSIAPVLPPNFLEEIAEDL